MRAPRRASGGFTLLEVLVATAILGVAVVSLLGLHARNLTLAVEAEQLTIATTLAEDVLALARLDPDLAEGLERGRFVPRPEDADDRNSIYGGPLSPDYTWTREVTPTALPLLKQLRVSVSRRDDPRPLAELWAAVATGAPR